MLSFRSATVHRKAGLPFGDLLNARSAAAHVYCRGSDSFNWKRPAHTVVRGFDLSEPLCSLFLCGFRSLGIDAIIVDSRDGPRGGIEFVIKWLLALFHGGWFNSRCKFVQNLESIFEFTSTVRKEN